MVKSRTIKDYDAAWECALRLLEQRPHTHFEVRTKLRQRQFAAADIDKVLTELERLKLVDDLEFARVFIREKIGSSRAVGRRRIMMELHRRGVASELAERAFVEVGDDEFMPAESERALAALEQKMRALRLQELDFKTRQKLWRFLSGRGFSSDAIRAAFDSYQA